MSAAPDAGVTAKTFDRSRLMPAVGIVLNAAVTVMLIPDVVRADRFERWLAIGCVLAVLFVIHGLTGLLDRGPELDDLPLGVHGIAASAGVWTGSLALIDPTATRTPEVAYVAVFLSMGAVLRLMLYRSLGLFRLIWLFSVVIPLIGGLALAEHWEILIAVAVSAVAATRIAIVTHREGIELHTLRQESADRAREAAWLADHDSLTGLLNRRGLEARAGETEIGYCLFLDLDHFKFINDSHGHEIGDRVLIEVGRRMVEIVGDRGLAGRLGGDEFLVLLKVGQDGDEIGAELLRAVRQPMNVAAIEPVVVSASAGGASVDAGFDLTTVMRRSDQALYAAKEGGRDRLVDGGNP